MSRDRRITLSQRAALAAIARGLGWVTMLPDGTRLVVGHRSALKHVLGYPRGGIGRTLHALHDRGLISGGPHGPWELTDAGRVALDG